MRLTKVGPYYLKIEPSNELTFLFLNKSRTELNN